MKRNKRQTRVVKTGVLLGTRSSPKLQIVLIMKERVTL